MGVSVALPGDPTN